MTPTSRLNTTDNAGGLSIRYGHFVDAQGRVQLLRGVNLGGASKLPRGYAHRDGVVPLPDDQFFSGNVSFVDRPFPLKDADLHFARLRRWGLTFVRLVVTWEAIEHEGPGIYDREYLAYIRALVAHAADYGILVYIDPHQDVWSRWTGGDGAPLWTMEAVGLEPRHFETTKASLCIETYCKKGSVPQFPKMIWPTNYFKLASATMFTLFWGGSQFAPSCHVNGVPVQEFLQLHYLNAMAQLAEALRGLKNVVGFGSMNEPSSGYIGVQDLSKCFQPGELKYDFAPTPFQGMCLGEAIPQVVGRWSNGFMQHVLGLPDSKELVDPRGTRAWKPTHRCIWKDEGVWTVDAQGHAKLLRPDYFAHVDFGRDCYVPFAAKFAERIYSILPQTLLFVELPPLEFSSTEFPQIDEHVIPRAVNATHWYDGVTLFLQTWRPWFSVDPKTKMPAFGCAAVRRMHERQLRHIKDYGKLHMNNAPCLIGETGIPYNLNSAKAYRTGDFSAQRDALNHTISCLEANLLSFTLWCYEASNCNKYGDQWNLEDLSLVSLDRQQPKVRDSDNNDEVYGKYEEAPEEDDDTSARTVLAFARPHATKIAGIPSKSIFRLNHARYVLEYASDVGKLSEHVVAPTEIFVPHVQYPRGYDIEVSDGKYDVQVHDGWDTVLYHHDEKHTKHTLVLTTKDPNVERRRKAQERRQQLMIRGAGIVLLTLLVFLLTR
ncbi:Glycosyl hydrolase, partial [Globisporangium splendens]